MLRRGLTRISQARPPTPARPTAVASAVTATVPNRAISTSIDLGPLRATSKKGKAAGSKTSKDSAAQQPRVMNRWGVESGFEFSDRHPERGAWEQLHPVIEERAADDFGDRKAEHQLFMKYAHTCVFHGPPLFVSSVDTTDLYDYLLKRFKTFHTMSGAKQYDLRVGESVSFAGNPDYVNMQLIEIVLEDRPFLTDTLLMALEELGFEFLVSLRLLTMVHRDAKRRLKSINLLDVERNLGVEEFNQADDVDVSLKGGVRQAHLQFLLRHPDSSQDVAEFRDRIETAVQQTIHVVDDFAALHRRLGDVRNTFERAAPQFHPNGKLVDWCMNENFVSLGMIDYDVVSDDASAAHDHDEDEDPLDHVDYKACNDAGLGLLRPDAPSKGLQDRIFEAARFYLRAHSSTEPFVVMEEMETAMSPIHRRSPLLLVMMSPDPSVTRTKVTMLVGLFSSQAHNIPALDVPLVKEKVQAVVQSRKLVPNSYAYKEVMDYMNRLPKFELFRLPPVVLDRMAEDFLEVLDQPQLHVSTITNSNAGSYRVMVSVPRHDFYSKLTLNQVRQAIEAHLGVRASNAFQLDVHALVCVHLIFYGEASDTWPPKGHSGMFNVVQQMLSTREERVLSLFKKKTRKEFEPLSTKDRQMRFDLARHLIDHFSPEYMVARTDVEIARDLKHMSRATVADAKGVLSVKTHAWVYPDYVASNDLISSPAEQARRASQRAADAKGGDDVNSMAGVDDEDFVDDPRPGSADQLGMDYEDEDTVAPQVVEAHMVDENGRIMYEKLPPAQSARVGIFADRKIALNKLLPVLSNMGLEPLEERAYDMKALPSQKNARQLVLHKFRVRLPENHLLHGSNTRQIAQNFTELTLRVLDGRQSDNKLNGLLFVCGFTWRQILALMTLRNFLMQIGNVFAVRTINDTLLKRGDATVALMGLLEARFDPDVPQAERAALVSRQREALHDATMVIDNLTEDRIFKRLENLVMAMVRTNYYQPEVMSGELGAMACKFDCTLIEEMPRPRPKWVISLSGPNITGVHIRFGMVARGGLRYSDRPDDFYIEVLGLVAAQQKKNVVIVPVGSKGGFVVHSLKPFGGNARLAGDTMYRTFIKSLLSVTDNVDPSGAIVHPPRTVHHDCDDPYLVVAADKGTAHLSDTANSISLERGFWLGDAFASGGSVGYDHKKQGITARGAWESAKHLFWKLGHNIQTQPFTVVGCGDMSGDVFGNGMLLSKQIKLVGAFNHIHIFIDPNPDPAVSFKERERLFRSPTPTTWKDYNAEAISSGGGVFPRGAKSIKITPEMREMLQVANSVEALSGEELIRALLMAPVDLQYAGGIGTYIKASTETHAEVGDDSNNAVRISADECRARVVCEGGNLSVTQNARVELDRRGVLLNTDAIDNSAGVDMSDHEVNLKILFKSMLDLKLIASMDERNKLIREIEPEVEKLVLADNLLQNLGITMSNAASCVRPMWFSQLVETLAEAEKVLDRRTERMPSPFKIMSMFGDGKGMPRPHLATLLAYSKMHLFWELEAQEGDGALSNEKFCEQFYTHYFPKTLCDRYDIASIPHQLRGAIIHTVVANKVINQAGMCSVDQLSRWTGCTWTEAARAYIFVDAVSGVQEVREAIYDRSLEVPTDVQLRVLDRIEVGLHLWSRWLLTHRERAPFDLDDVEKTRERFTEFLNNVRSQMLPEDRASVGAFTDEVRAAGLPDGLCELSALSIYAKDFGEAMWLADNYDITLADACQLQRTLSVRLHLSEIEEELDSIVVDNPIDSQYRVLLARSMASLRQNRVEAVLSYAREKGSTDASEWVDIYLMRHEKLMQNYEATYERVTSAQSQAGSSLSLVEVAILAEMLQHL